MTLFNHEYHSPSQNDIIKSRSVTSCQVSPLYFKQNKNESSKIRIFSHLHQNMNTFLVHCSSHKINYFANKMPTRGTKQQQKLAKVSKGKVCLDDTVLVLQDTLKALNSGDPRDLKKLPVRISLALKGISLVTDLLEDALRLDGTLRSAEVAQEKRDQIRNNRLQQSSTKNIRKPEHELRLQTAVKTPRKSKACPITIRPSILHQVA